MSSEDERPAGLDGGGIGSDAAGAGSEASVDVVVGWAVAAAGTGGEASDGVGSGGAAETAADSAAALTKGDKDTGRPRGT
jgi:hypothetical protein